MPNILPTEHRSSQMWASECALRVPTIPISSPLGKVRQAWLGPAGGQSIRELGDGVQEKELNVEKCPPKGGRLGLGLIGFKA